MSDPFALTADLEGALRRRVFDRVRPGAERLLGMSELTRLYRQRPSGVSGFEFLDWALRVLDVRLEADPDELEQLPRKGAAVVVANHPFGGLEGIVLGHLLRRRRPDVKIVANYLLGRIPELRDVFLFVDPFGTRDAVRANLGAIREALSWLAGGGVLVMFPAGEVAHYDVQRRRVEDPSWLPTVARLVRRAKCPVLPAYFGGRNGLAFQALGLVHPRLRTAMLARALLARRGKTVEARFGSLIPFRQLVAHGGDEDVVAYLRNRTYVLGERPSLSESPVQPRTTPRESRPIAPPHPVETLEAELEQLPPERLLVEAGDQVVYVAEAERIPAVLHEIGRLREISFREVGEGTGRAIDLDVFDSDYRHLFIWSRTNREIVGAYRLGLTDRLIRRGGIDGLYTSTLFSFKPRLFESMGPALELGRSFIRPQYQKSYQGLMLLWKGIGQFVLRHPRYATLFGPVSISADYRSASQRLIVAFLEQNKYAHEWARWVRPRVPPRARHSRDCRLSPAELKDLDDVSTFIAEIEADHKGVPILLKQYLKLGGRLLGFNVDPAFSNVLDVLIMVDLRCTKPKILERYMGRDGATRFLSRQPHARAS